MKKGIISLYVALLLLHTQSIDASCDDDSDCSYNGKCLSKVCRCESAFRGEFCDAFDFAPRVFAESGLRTLEENGTYTSSWGGSVLLGDDGMYHMWASEMTYSTGIKAWLTNSRIVHAVADDKTRPFVFRRTNLVHPIFAHEPTVSRAPSGEYVMFYTSNYGETPGSQCSSPCTCGFNGTSCLSCLNDQQCDASPRSPLSSFMSFSEKSPNGPWSTPELISAPTTGDTNLACIINDDSSLICMGRPGLGRMYSTHWRNVSNYVWQDTEGDPIIGEDPMIWRDETHESVIHLVTHGGGWGDPFGYHYYSEDSGITWYGTGNKAYENDVYIEGQNDPIILSRRERPHVVLDAKNRVIGMTNGVTEAWPCMFFFFFSYDDDNSKTTTTTTGTLQVEPDRPPCKHPNIPGVNPNCGPGSNGTSIWCPVDASYTLFQAVS